MKQPHDYRELGLPGAARVAARCFLFESFLEALLRKEPGALIFQSGPANLALHAHCHVKATLQSGAAESLANRRPGCATTALDTGCCGMAGAFGAMKTKYELSRQIGAALATKIAQQPAGTTVVASGASCRQQITHLTSRRPKHLAEVLAAALPLEPPAARERV